MRTVLDATGLAAEFHIDLDKNFYTLRADEVEAVLAAADRVKYRKPRNANGSRGRYFFAALQRAAHKAE